MSARPMVPPAAPDAPDAPVAAAGGPTEESVGILRVDWPACMGRGVCAEVLPELVTLDEWGYPIVAGPVTADLRELAREAVTSCPHAALKLLPPRR
ncbi:MAG: ferredoxin [Dermatophilaceae bacterium]